MMTQNPIEKSMLDENSEKTSFLCAASNDSMEDKKLLLLLDFVECWHILKTNENLRAWRWFLKTLPQAFTLGDLQAELLIRPHSIYSDRAHALTNLIARA
jgi:hypothetical protein